MAIAEDSAEASLTEKTESPKILNKRATKYVGPVTFPSASPVNGDIDPCEIR